MALQNSTGAERVDASYDDLKVVTKSDTIGPTQRLGDVRALRSTAGGAITLITERAETLALAAGAAPTAAAAVAVTLTAGETLPIRAVYVLSTGTAAADIEALF